MKTFFYKVVELLMRSTVNLTLYFSHFSTIFGEFLKFAAILY